MTHISYPIWRFHYRVTAQEYLKTFAKLPRRIRDSCEGRNPIRTQRLGRPTPLP